MSVVLSVVLFVLSILLITSALHYSTLQCSALHSRKVKYHEVWLNLVYCATLR